MEANETKKDSSKHWLQRLKDESWEAELLVSAVAIFGTFKLFDIVGWVTNTFINILNPDLYKPSYIIIILGLLAVSFLVALFLIHFALRAYWVGLIGLNSVYPDYNINENLFSKIYVKRLISILPTIKESIEKVDKLCSVIFSVAFIAFLIYINVAIIFSIYLLFYNIFLDVLPYFLLISPIYILGFLLVSHVLISALANLKVNHEKQKLQVFAFKLHKLVSTLMFGPLYKSIFQINMMLSSRSNRKERTLKISFIVIVAMLFFTSYHFKNTNLIYLRSHNKYTSKSIASTAYYKINNNENTFLINPEIESDIINQQTMKVFIPVFLSERNKAKELCNYKSKGLKEEEKSKLLDQCYKNYISIKVNDSIINPEILRINHERTRQKGVVAYINTSSLKPGKNNISVKKGNLFNWSLPFFLEK
ncbi:conserved membrane hypothetical protein [Tenacibaculum sp. 190524A05c]|uniref:hypothetical protein n=1 Tax=Tenacibaculum platacis TaxID=3137852 RepID=UPI0031FB76B1